MSAENKDELIQDIMNLYKSCLFLGKEAYRFKAKLEKFLGEIEGANSLSDSQERKAEGLIQESKKIKSGDIRFTAWRVQKGKHIVGIRMLTQDALWDEGPYWYEESPFWLSSKSGVVPFTAMKLVLDEEFKTELKGHLVKMNTAWGKLFEQSLWYFVSLVAVGIAYGFWKGNDMLVAGSIVLGCLAGSVIYLVNRYTGLTTSMERRNQFKTWLTQDGEINADAFLSLLNDKLELWGPALEAALQEVELKE